MKDFQQLWNDWTWRGQVNEWAREALAHHDILMGSDLEVTQVRPWSIVLHTLTDAGKIYFKAPPPVLIHEAQLTQALSQWFPQWIPEVLAVEPNEGWWLAHDGGESIRANVKATHDLSDWIQAVQLYAQLQKGLVDHVPDMLALGVPDRRSHTLPAQLASLLEHPEMLLLDLPKGLTTDEFKRLKETQAPLAEWCGQLEASKIPISLHHGDLNSGNVLKHGGHFAFVDWGDCSVAHPFSSLRTVLVSAEIDLDLPDYSPKTAPLRDAYLHAWTEYDSAENVMRDFRLAQRLSALVSALAWYNDLVELTEEERAPYGYTVPSLLQEFLDADMEKYPFV